MNTRYLNRFLAASLCALSLYAGGSMAGEGQSLVFELNNARQTGGNCRLSFVIQSKMPATVEALSLEIVLFDGHGMVDRFLKLKAGALPMGKMRVKQFDLKGRKCTDISKILINEIAECKGQKLNPAVCSGRLSISSRTPIKLQF